MKQFLLNFFKKKKFLKEENYRNYTIPKIEEYTKIITSIEEVMNFNINDKVKINFNISKIYAFNERGILTSSPFGDLYV